MSPRPPTRRRRALLAAPLAALAALLVLAPLAGADPLTPENGGSTLFVPAAVGKARAFEMALLGSRVESARALEWGLVNSVHLDDRLLPEAEALVERLAAGPTRAYASSKRALNEMLYPRMEAQLDLEAELQHSLARTGDFMEGVGAFVEKRSPAFQGA